MKITLGSHGRAFSGCMAPLNFVQFADTPPGMELWAARLVTDFWINSVVACLSSYANGTEIAEGWERLNAFSEELAPGIPVPEYATVLERVERLGKIPVVDVMAGVVRNSTVLITRGAYDSGLKTQVGGKCCSDPRTCSPSRWTTTAHSEASCTSCSLS